MSLAPIWWPLVPETLEAKLAQTEADAEFAKKWENADFKSLAESMANALWGIWEVPINKGLSTIEKIRRDEKEDWDSPELILAQLDAWEWDESIFWDNWWENPNENNERQKNIYTPSVSYLREKWIINNQEEKALIDHFVEWWDINEIWGKGIFDSTKKKQEVVGLLFEMTQSEESTEKNFAQFDKTIWKFLQIQKDSKGNILWARTEEAYNMIWSQFFVLGWSEEWRDYRKEFNHAIHTAYNILLDGAIDIKWQETKFNRLSWIILDSSKSFQERFEAFTKFLEFSHTQKWAWKLQEKNYRIKSAEAKLENIWKLEYFKELLDRFHTERESQTANAEIALELEAMRKEAWLTKAEATLLAGWENDTLSDSSGENGDEN